VVKNVEKLGSELCSEPFLELHSFCQRKIPVVIGQATENPRSHRTVAPVRGRDQNRSAYGVATQIGERCHSEWSHSLGLSETGRVRGASEIGNSMLSFVGVDQGLTGLKVRRISEEIPLFPIGTRAVNGPRPAEIRGCVVDAPRQPARQS